MTETVEYLDFHTLDRNFDRAVDVARNEEGTLYIQTNSPDGRLEARIGLHPHLAVKLRDWLVENYHEGRV